MVTTDAEEGMPGVALGATAFTEATPGSTFPLEPPFGPEFFQTVLRDHVRDTCADRTEELPVVQLRLADGSTLDLCHIVTVERLWFSVQAYRDPDAGEEMDLVFVPYESVTLVTLSLLSQRQRPIGFQLVD